LRRLRLRSLFLTANSIGDEGFINHLAPAIHDNDSLQILELRKNRITDEGAKALAKILSMKGQVVGFSSSGTGSGKNSTGDNLQLTSKSQLTSLFLSGNQIGDEGAVKLVTCEGLQNCKIWLADNPISDDTKAAIREVAGKHRVKL
jgi:Ran GTPase-activating protein (RanGAP) involved in mRNA processing and transport